VTPAPAARRPSASKPPSRPTRSQRPARGKRSGCGLFILGILVGGGLLFALSYFLGPTAFRPSQPSPSPSQPAPPKKPTAATPVGDGLQTSGETEGTEVVEPREGDPVGRLALVIDDLGSDVAEVETLEALGVPLTYSVLPFREQTPQVVALLREHRREILCHLPMEPENDHDYDPGPGALRLGMTDDELRERTAAALGEVPGAAGVNNHMGSGLSADERSMRTILGVLAKRNLFFLDSRTSARSVGYRVATSLGMPAAERQVFLDDDRRPELIEKQFARWLEKAKSRGAAIAIGHPHPETLAVLEREVSRAREAGFQFVPVSYLLDRPGSPD
jgi:polysaccharide deacetylase 2 family uncharacterized protein YibQ